jgi:sulfur carrier protein
VTCSIILNTANRLWRECVPYPLPVRGKISILFEQPFRNANMILLTVNGVQHQFAQQPNVMQLLEQLALKGKRIAVERNGEIVPRSRFEQEQLSDGDKLEIVVAVGGG